MKQKAFIPLILSTILSANSLPTEEVISMPQTTHQNAQTQNSPAQNPQTQPQSPNQDSVVTQVPIQSHNTLAPNQPDVIQPQQTQNPHNQPMPNASYTGGNYGASLQTILNKARQMYPGAFITDIDYKGFGYEVEINDNLELFFDHNGNFIGQKWD